VLAGGGALLKGATLRSATTPSITGNVGGIDFGP